MPGGSQLPHRGRSDIAAPTGYKNPHSVAAPGKLNTVRLPSILMAGPAAVDALVVFGEPTPSKQYIVAVWRDMMVKSGDNNPGTVVGPQKVQCCHLSPHFSQNVDAKGNEGY